MNNFEDCLKKGLLRRITPSRDKAESSMRKAERWLYEAERNLNSGAYDSCLISSYLAMFHAVRAILFKDGWREKSHYRNSLPCWASAQR